MSKIYKTPRAEQDFVNMYQETAKKYGKAQALKQKGEVAKAEKEMLENSNAGTLDPEYHSDRFRYIRIPTSQKIFFERFKDDVIIVTAGWHGRQWNNRLEEIDLHANQQIDRLKQTIIQKAQKKSDKAKSIGKLILPASQGGKGSDKKKPPAPEKSQDKDDHEK